MSRLERIKSENPKLDISFIDIIATIDPTSTYKYLPFIIKQVKQSIGEEGMNALSEIIAKEIFSVEFIDSIKKFEEHCKENRIKKNDISQYKDINEINEEVKKADELKKLRESEKQVIKLYDGDDYLVFIPITYYSCKTFGAGTKWCITTESTWNSYVWKHRFIFIIDRVNNTKYAISRTYSSNEIKAWTETDVETNILWLPIKKEILFLVIENIKAEKFSLELGALKPNEIFDNRGNIINKNDATRDQIHFFETNFGKNERVSYKDVYGDDFKFDDDLLTFDDDLLTSEKYINYLDYIKGHKDDKKYNTL